MRRREFLRLGGVAALWPLNASAQQGSVRTVGFLFAGSLSKEKKPLDSFLGGLEEAGYVVGKNVAIEYRDAQGQYARLPSLAADLVNHRVAVIVAIGGIAPAKAAMASTNDIPIVFSSGGDPVKAGLVKSLNRPGGNITGVALFSRSYLPNCWEFYVNWPPAHLL